MKEPTEAQIKEFWERCGLKLHTKVSKVIPDFASYKWEYPDGSMHTTSPPIDLNNLFKYAVPEVKDPDDLYEILARWIVEITCTDSDPALALFGQFGKLLRSTNV